MRSLKYWKSSILFYSNLGPHAGYRYCGACAAHAYSQIDPTNIERVFILGPSHHYRLNGCAVSNCNKYETPLYDLHVSENNISMIRKYLSYKKHVLFDPVVLNFLYFR